MHEVLIGIPTHNLGGYAFAGMMGQIPLILVTQSLHHMRAKLWPNQSKEIFDTIGNLIFWSSFTVLGQPICVVFYYYIWQKG